MTLLQQIQNEAVATNPDIAALLRRCRILAQRLAVDEFKNWVIWELEGYPDVESLPPYRVVDTQLILGEFSGPFGSGIRNAQIPISSIPEQWRNFLTTLPFTQGVGSIAEMLRDDKDSMRVPWPADVLPYIGQGDIYANMHLLQAVRCVNSSAIRDILDQVQNRVLNFVLELESRNPEAGEAMMNSPKIPEQQVRNIFRTVIKGDVQNFAQASKHFTQTAQEKIVAGDIKSLKRALSEIGLEEQELKGLEVAIRDDKRSGKEGMGEKVKAWIGNIAVKVSSGAVTIATAAGTTAVTEAVKAYFGC